MWVISNSLARLFLAASTPRCPSCLAVDQSQKQPSFSSASRCSGTLGKSTLHGRILPMSTIIDNDSDSASEYQDSESAEPERSNKWKGPPSTWLGLTAQDRGVVKSLEAERDTDLSVHLYNAHALKQRAKILSDDPENRLRNEYPEVPIGDQIFRPPKIWTAWPLPPDEVPKSGVSNEADEKYTYKRRDEKFASSELEDVLIGVTLKFARERFESRESAAPEDENVTKEDVELIEDEDEVLSFDGMETTKLDDQQNTPRKPSLQPVVSADDEKSRAILRPSVRSTLSKIDEILVALHHARKTCRRYSFSELETDDDTLSMTGSISASRRPKGRPRKVADLPDRSLSSAPRPQEPDDPELFRTKRSHRGRPQKVYPHIPGETQQDYLVRVARIQKKPLPSFAPPLEVKEDTSVSPERITTSPKKRATSEERYAREKRYVGMRDWTEVLGSAALVGVPESVLKRATQRCANLFGESMLMRSIIEAPFADEGAYSEKVYQPAVISDPGDDSSSNETSESSAVSEVQKDIKTLRRNLSFMANSVFCPIPDCPRKRKGFKHNTALKKHLQFGHSISKDQLDEYILDSDDEMDGAVHIDGFLKPIKAFRKPKRKLKVATKKESSSEEDMEDGEGQVGMDSDEGDARFADMPGHNLLSPVGRSASNED